MPDQKLATAPDRLEEELLALPGPQEDAPPGGPTPEGEGPVAPEVVFDPALVELLVSIPFDLLAARRGDHWRLNDGEKAAIVPVLGRVLDKYLPSAMGRFGDELALATVLAVIVVPRMQKDAQTEAANAAADPYHPGAPRYDAPAGAGSAAGSPAAP